MIQPKVILSVAVAVTVTIAVVQRSVYHLHAESRMVQSVAGIAEEDLFLLWTITADAYVACSRPAYAIRRIQREFDGRVPLVVVYDGVELRSVEHLLQTERLSGMPLSASSVDAQRLPLSESEAVLYVVREGVSVAKWLYLEEGVSSEQVKKAITSHLVSR